MSLYVYAILGEVSTAPLGDGLRGEPLRLVAAGGILAAVGEVDTSPAPDPAALRGHDAVVRRLGAAVRAVLPVRFGSTAADEPALVERLARASVDLRQALELVAGREQMTLRLFGTPLPGASPGGGSAPAMSAPPAPDGVVPDRGPGTRYLAVRVRARSQAQRVPELDPLRDVLSRFVLAERLERHETPPLLASVYHLLTRGAGPAYTTAVTEAAGGLATTRVVVSGPWPPYAFAAEVVA